LLFMEPVDQKRSSLPSPEELKHKILIKAKKNPTDCYRKYRHRDIQ